VVFSGSQTPRGFFPHPFSIFRSRSLVGGPFPQLQSFLRTSLDFLFFFSSTHEPPTVWPAPLGGVVKTFQDLLASSEPPSFSLLSFQVCFYRRFFFCKHFCSEFLSDYILGLLFFSTQFPPASSTPFANRRADAQRATPHPLSGQPQLRDLHGLTDKISRELTPFLPRVSFRF